MQLAALLHFCPSAITSACEGSLGQRCSKSSFLDIKRKSKQSEREVVRRASATVPTADPGCNALVRLKLAIPYHCNWGQHLCLVGSDERLGSWNIDQGLTMQWSDGDLWSVDVELPIEWGTELEYKYVVRGEDGSVYWKPGCNLCIRIPASEEESWLPGSIAVRDAWDDSARCIEVGAREADEQELVSRSMERALRELDSVIGHAFGMQDRFTDPSAPERLAADRAVAAAARHAIALTKALKGSGGQLKYLKGQQDDNTPAEKSTS